MLEIPTTLAEAVADSRRANIWDGVPTEPTAEMVAAPVHIVVVTWKAPPINDAADDRVCWAIVGHHLLTGHFMQTGEISEARPMDSIVSDVLAALEEQGQPAWVVVSKKRVMLATALQTAGVTVTRGLNVANRAASRALTVGSTIPQEMRSAPYIVRWQSGTNPDKSEATAKAPSPTWWPSLRVDKPTTPCHLIIGTDASADRSGAVCISAIGQNGAGRLEAFRSNDCITESEFAAVILGLELAKAAGARKATILTDNQGAAVVANAIIAGGTPKPGFHGIGSNYIQRFKEMLDGFGGEVCVAKVKGHNGHVLNEIADKVAVLGRVATRFPRQEVILELHLRVAELWASAATLSPLDISLTDETHEYLTSDSAPLHALTHQLPTATAPAKTGLTYSIGDILKDKLALAG